MRSVLFWFSLGAATVVFALLTVSPRLLEFEQLRVRYLTNAGELRELRRQNEHLERVRHAFEADADFRARVASAEFHAVPTRGTRIHLDESLTHDARVPADSSPQPAIQQRWYVPWLERLTTSSPLRSRLMVAMVTLLLFAFFCLDEDFSSGELGKTLGRGFRRISRRYLIDQKSESL